MKRLMQVLPLCVAARWEAGMLISPASAHGSGAGASSGAMVLLIFPAAAIIFGLFLVITRPKE